MLSSAVATRSMPHQKSLSKIFSVDGPTNSCNAVTLMFLFINRARSNAAADLAWPTLSARKRNCRLRLETSIRSLSVIVRLPKIEHMKFESAEDH